MKSGKFLQLCVAWRSARAAGGLAEKARTEGWRLLRGGAAHRRGKLERN